MHVGKPAPVLLGALTALSLFTGACATKKHVREAIAPVQNQVNDVQKKTEGNTTAIGDLDRNVARVDEKAMEADRKAASAGDAANKANELANQAGQRADAANSLAQQANSKVGELDVKFDNLDNYKLVNTQKVYFKVNHAELSKDDQAQLDQLLQSLQSTKNYVVEVQGSADRTGSKAMNLELSRRRADAVVRYLVEHGVSLRRIHDVGVGADLSQDARTRAARKEERRVDVKVFNLDLANSTAAQNQMPTQTQVAK